MRHNSLPVTAALALLGGSCALAQTTDINGDGTPDSLQLDLGFNPDAPVTGRVTVHSGADGAALIQIDGPAPNDAFAFSADFISDLNGDGTPDLAVAAPRAAVTSDRVGRVYLYSGADGTLLRTIFGRRGDRIGMYVGTDMPGYLVHKRDHTGAEDGLASFHSILSTDGGLWGGNQYITPEYDRQQILSGLEHSYDLWGRPQVWTVAKEWLRRKGFNVD